MTSKKTNADARREWPLNRRESGLLEIVCPHGVGHPAPRLNVPGYNAVHGCDGCCGSVMFAIAEQAHLAKALK